MYNRQSLNRVHDKIHKNTNNTKSESTKQEHIIVDYIKQYGSIRKIIVEDTLGVKTSRVKEILNSLSNKQALKISGFGPPIKYILK